MTPTIISALVYLILLPIIFRSFAFIHRKIFIDRRMQKIGNNRAALKSLPKPIWPKWKERISFTVKDKRIIKNLGVTRSQMFFGLFIIGFLISTLGMQFGYWKVSIAANLIFFIALIFAIKSADPIIQTRHKIYKKMFEVGRSKLGLSSEFEDQPQAVIQVLEWVDYIKPQKVQFEVPTTFASEGEEGFLRQYNQVFGTETTWVPADDPETGKPGWNYEEGVATFYAVPPLPQRAEWSEHYLLSPGVAWSFFPIGLGVENGLELLNPNTGETENVLGFDLSGEQEKEARKHGLKMSNTITTSPQVFIGGGTGGGKALPINTLIKTFTPKDKK